MFAKSRGKGSITLVEVLLAVFFLLCLGIALLVLTNRAKEKAQDHAVAEQLNANHGIRVMFGDDDRPARAEGRRTSLSDESVQFLLELETLPYLNLNHCGQIVEYLPALATHDGITQLCLVGTSIDVDSPAVLAQMGQLRWLDLRLTRLTSDSLRPLQGCEKLVQLDLDESLVDDDIAEVLAGFPSLQRVSLRLTRVTDAGLRQLIMHPTIQRIDVSGALISRKALEDARNSRPDLIIECSTPKRIGSYSTWHREWAKSELNSLGILVGSNRQTVIPEGVGNEVAFALLYARPINLIARNSKLTDAAIPMLLANGAFSFDFHGTRLHWHQVGTAVETQMVLRSHLSLERTLVDDDSFESPFPFPARRITLSDTAIGDLGLRRWMECDDPSRKYWSGIQLDGTRITDAAEPALRKILKLPMMERLDVRRTALSAEVQSRLKSDHPLVEIITE